MCGRFTQSSPVARYGSMFGIQSGLHFAPSYNVAPSQPVLACRLSDLGWREIVPLTWGLLPHWSKTSKFPYSTINARAETVAIKPAFRDAFRKRRCLVPCDGFYEWKPGKPRKQPYFIHRKDEEPFAIAGLWERWEQDRTVIETCTLIVTGANALISSIHDRMPVILPPSEFEQWLDPKQDQKRVLDMLQPYPDGEIEAYPVGLDVNKPENNNSDLIKRL